MTAKMYYEKDADKNVLKKKTIAVIGYGSQGHAQAQNLRDSGIHVLVADLPGSDNYRLAIEHNFAPLSAAEASSRADIIHILLPDEIQKRVYTSEIAEKLKGGKALAFSHGFNIHLERSNRQRTWMCTWSLPRAPVILSAVFTNKAPVCLH